MEVVSGGCSSGSGNTNMIAMLNCEDNSNFDVAYCPKVKGYSFSVLECNVKCLEMENCVMYQRSGSGVCFFYNQPDPDGSNGDSAWRCGVKTCLPGKNFLKNSYTVSI